MEEKRMARELRWKGELFIIENVPIGVCAQCGEKVLRPQVAKSKDKVLQKKRAPVRTIQVPVYQYEPRIV